MKYISIGAFVTLIINSCANERRRDSEIHIVNGDSVQITYNQDSGYKSTMFIIKNGHKNGLFKSYYSNGNTREIGLMKNNNKDGLWRLFDKHGNMASAFHYSNGILIAAPEKEDFNLKSVNLIEGKVTVNVPSKWQTEVINSPDGVLLVSQKMCDTVVFCPNIIVSHHEMKNLAFKTYIEEYVYSLKSNFPDFGIVYGNDVKINGKESYQMGIKLTKNNILIVAVLTIIKVNNEVFIITGTSSNEDREFFKYKGLFEQIASTFN